LKTLPAEGRQVIKTVGAERTAKFNIIKLMAPQSLTNTNQVTCYVYWMIKKKVDLSNWR